MSVVEQLQDPIVEKGLFQVGAALMFAGMVMSLSAWRGLALERELTRAFVRGLIQVLAMGTLIGVLFSLAFEWSIMVLVGMSTAAAWISKDRGKEIPHAFQISWISILVGAGFAIVTMVVAGAIELTIQNLVPVGGLIIANAMKTNSLTLDRFKNEIETHRPQIEALLALGIPPRTAISQYMTTTIRAALIPTIDSLKSLGLVHIPGMMSGMILAGANPIYAAEYQFVILSILFACGGLTSMTSAFLMGEYAFTEAQQLKRFEAETV